MKSLQKMGGIAALGHTTALVMGMILSFTLMFPLLDAAPDQALNFLSSHPALTSLWIWVVDWVAAVTFVIMLLALYERKKDMQSTVKAPLVLSKDFGQRRCTHSITEVGRK